MNQLGAKFNYALSLGEGVLDSTANELLKQGVIPSEFSGLQTFPMPDFLCRTEISYGLKLLEFELSLERGATDTVGLNVKFESTLGSVLNLQAIPNSHAKTLPFLGFDVFAELSVRAKLEVAKDDKDQTFICVNVQDLSGFSIEIDFGSISPDPLLEELIERLATRAVEVFLVGKVVKIPISSAISAIEFGGWPVANTAVRVVDSGNGQMQDLCFAFNTWPNRRRGNPAKLRKWTESSDNFGIVVDQRAMRQAFDHQWQNGMVPRRFATDGKQDESGPVFLKAVEFDLREDQIYFMVRAVLETKVGPQEVVITALCSVSYKNGKFGVDIKEIGTKISAGKGIFQNLLFRSILIFVNDLANAAFKKKVSEITEEKLAEFLNSSSLPLEYGGSIPNTPVEIVGTVTDIEVHSNEITASGDIVFQ